MTGDVYRIQREPIDVGAVLRLLDNPGAGGQALFLGVVRDEFEGRKSCGLTYDAYEPLAEREMARVGDELHAEWSLIRVVIVHRIGDLAVGEASVLVACAAAHRGAAMEACRAGIDRLKVRVPIWKQEHWEDGEDAWHGAPGGPPANQG